MKTLAENLPIEVWITIFSYLKVHDLFHAFNSLNSYFNQILISNHLSFNLHLQQCDFLFKTVPMVSPWPTNVLNRIACLKSATHGRGIFISNFLRWHGEKLIRLKSLIIGVYNSEIQSNCIEFIASHPIEYVRLKCRPNRHLLDAILCSSTIRKCALHLSGSGIINDYRFRMNNYITILYLSLSVNTNVLVFYEFLSNLPNLRRFHLLGSDIDRYLNISSKKSDLKLLNLFEVKLRWFKNNTDANYFEHLLFVMPNVKHLSVGMVCNYLNENLIENLLKYWWPCLEKIPRVKLNICCKKIEQVTNRNKKLVFDNYCEQIFHNVNQRSDAYFNVKWHEDNLETHKIQIMIKNF